MNWIPKRFWKEATVERTDDGYAVRLDGRAVKTPAKTSLVVPTEAMAEAIAKEWQAQDDKIDPNTMPVTRAANAAIDKVAVQFEEVAGLLAAYGDSDVTCYRAESPEELVARQAVAWDPLLEWAERSYDARLIPVQGVIHAPQRPQALERLAAPLFSMSSFELTAMHDLISLSGSLVIGLAARDQHAPLETLWTMSRIDELWQIEQWGEDEEAAETAQVKYRAFLDAGVFLTLSQ